MSVRVGWPESETDDRLGMVASGRPLTSRPVWGNAQSSRPAADRRPKAGAVQVMDTRSNVGTSWSPRPLQVSGSATETIRRRTRTFTRRSSSCTRNDPSAAWLSMTTPSIASMPSSRRTKCSTACSASEKHVRPRKCERSIRPSSRAAQDAARRVRLHSAEVEAVGEDDDVRRESVATDV